MYLHKIILISASIFLTGCESSVQAPVEEVRPQFSMNHPSTSYTVKPNDTLYAIAFLFDQNVEQLAHLNHLTLPYRLRTGQILKLSGYRATQVHQMQSFMRPPISHGAWIWPTKGIKQISSQNPIQAKGMNIMGEFGQSIVASQAGVVAYAGNGLPGYGLLILIKHSNDYLTAYAFNSKILVQEGQSVHQGQYIASMGYLAPGKAGLHFEIRYKGIAVNPKRFLS